MIKVQFLGTSPVDFEGFPKRIARTIKGALHLKPKTVYNLSQDEFDFIKKERPDLRFSVFKAEKKFERPVPKSDPIPPQGVEKDLSEVEETAEQETEFADEEF